MIDTPGFNDSERVDTDVLMDIATWLTLAWEKNIKLDGVIYMHGIHDPRMKGTDVTHLKMFKRMTGFDNMKMVVLVTSFWNTTDPAVAQSRENQLKEKDGWWKEMLDKKASVMHFKNDKESSLQILDTILAKADEHKDFLKIQLEMNQDHKTIGETDAGLVLDAKIHEAVREMKQKYENETQELNEALAKKDAEAAEKLLESQRAMEQKIRNLENSSKRLDIDATQLLKDKDAEIRNLREEMKQEVEKAKVETLAQFQSQLTAYLEGMADKETENQQRPPPESFESIIRRVISEQSDTASTVSQRSQPPPYAPPYGYYPQQPPPQQQQPIPDYSAAVQGAVAGGAVIGGATLASMAAGLVCNVM